MQGENHKAVVDQLKRPLQDLRISVTDRCNFRCVYCMPSEIFGPDYPFLKEKMLLNNQEIVQVAKSFSQLGVNKIRITGGEPLMRKDLTQLVGALSKIEGITDIAMTTNGSLLRSKAKELKMSGLNRVTVSLDSLNDETFGQINGRGFKVQTVLKGIEAAKEAGLEVKVNMLVKRGVNEDEVIPMARYFQGSGHVLRFIEFMDVGNTNGWKMDDVVTRKQILNLLQQEFSLKPIDANYFGEVATRYVNEDTGDEIGIISSISGPFCSSCTRARLSADGKIYTCLFATKGTDLRGPMRNGATEADILKIIEQTWENRVDQYSALRTKETVAARSKEKIEMSYIGG
ncbi:GTP 3',8-cyclase MoaA [Bacillus carboniphilus]|uniref:GTP 3',8-cyclase n=1 Tax=Bacillus carboniphilus TaxID=86663 RepID=A0ABN0W472_9BACI